MCQFESKASNTTCFYHFMQEARSHLILAIKSNSDISTPFLLPSPASILPSRRASC